MDKINCSACGAYGETTHRRGCLAASGFSVAICPGGCVVVESGSTKLYADGKLAAQWDTALTAAEITNICEERFGASIPEKTLEQLIRGHPSLVAYTP